MRKLSVSDFLNNYIEIKKEKDFSDFMKLVRQDRNLLQYELGKLMNISQSEYQRLEANKKQIRLKHCLMFSEIFGYTMILKRVKGQEDGEQGNLEVDKIDEHQKE